jgi:hypothetical protein
VVAAGLLLLLPLLPDKPVSPASYSLHSTRPSYSLTFKPPVRLLSLSLRLPISTPSTPKSFSPSSRTLIPSNAHKPPTSNTTPITHRIPYNTRKKTYNQKHKTLVHHPSSSPSFHRCAPPRCIFPSLLCAFTHATVEITSWESAVARSHSQAPSKLLDHRKAHLRRPF